MGETSKIEWTDATWNPVRGCTKISPGCAHCYAETFAERQTKCTGCQRSAEIHLGDTLGDDRRKWRAEMWEINPSMRFMMRAGPGETFQED